MSLSSFATSADEIVARCNGCYDHHQVRLLRRAEVEGFEVSAAVALTRQHLLDVGVML